MSWPWSANRTRSARGAAFLTSFFRQAKSRDSFPPACRCSRKTSAPAALLELRSHVAWESASSIPASFAAALRPGETADDEHVEIISHFPLLPPRPWPRQARELLHRRDTAAEFHRLWLGGSGWRKNSRGCAPPGARALPSGERIVCMSRWAANSVAGADATQARRASVGATAAAGITFPHGAANSPRVIRTPGVSPFPAPAALPQPLDRA